MGGYALPRTDYRYGHVCPECAAPKTVQAARCATCYGDARRRGDYPMTGPDNPNWKGGYQKPSRATGGSTARPQPQSHPWRKPRVQAV